MVDQQLREEDKTELIDGRFKVTKVWKDRKGNEFVKDENGKFIMTDRFRPDADENRDDIIRVADVEKNRNDFDLFPNLNNLFSKGPPPVMEKPDKDHPAANDNGDWEFSEDLKKELDEEAERLQKEWDEEHGGNEMFALLSILFTVLFVFYLGYFLSMLVKRAFAEDPKPVVAKRRTRRSKARA